MTSAIIIRTGLDYKGRLELSYSYKANIGELNGREIFPDMRLAFAEKIVGRSLPLLYQKNEPEKSHLLASYLTFKYFNIAFPDSLLWIRSYEKR